MEESPPGIWGYWALYLPGGATYLLAQHVDFKVGINTNPLNLDYPKYEMLATCYWFKTIWERIWYYSFTWHLDLQPILPPHEGSALMSYLFLDQPADARISLNRCRISHRMFCKSGIVTANGRQTDKEYLLPASDNVEADNSRFTWQRATNG